MITPSEMKHRPVVWVLLIAALLWPAVLSAEPKAWLGGADYWDVDAKWDPVGAPVAGDDVTIGSGTVKIRNVQAADNVDIQNTATLQFEVWNQALSAIDITVRSGGKITHIANTDTGAPWVETAGMFIECTNLTVDSGGQVNADAVGFAGGPEAATGRGPAGGSYYYCGGGGGGHAGAGGLYKAQAPGGSTYGSSTDPVTLGSGGGGACHTRIGGAGGGYVKIVASGTVAVNGIGVISAGGGNGLGAGPDRSPGGGAGGSINIQCAVLSGAGTIRANGAYTGSSWGGGGGGGGRVKISTTSPSTFTGSITANGGDRAELGVGGGGGSIVMDMAAGSSAPGFVSVKVGVGSYVFPDPRGNGPGTVSLSDWALLPSTLDNGGAARFTAPPGKIGDLTIGNYELFLDGWGWGNRLQARNIVIQSGGRIRHTWNTDTSAPWNENAGVFVDCTSLTIESGGQIRADVVGYAGGYGSVAGYGPGPGSYAYCGGSGAGHGGAGGAYRGAGGGTTYGSDTNPATLGSGAGGSCHSRTGGAGGGHIQIVATRTVTVDSGGYISANAGNALGAGPDRDAGGGAGGSINIRCGGLEGGGTLRANGGTGLSGYGGGGGGGRIAVYYSHLDFSGTASVNGGTANSPGLPGGVGSLHFEYVAPEGTLFFFQ